MKAIVTKYALSSGPLLIDGIVKTNAESGRSMICAKSSGWISNDYYHGKEFQLTKAEAVKRVEEMSDALIKSLKKRLENAEKKKAAAIAAINQMELE